MTNSPIARILLLDSDKNWCEPVSTYISQRLENVGCPCEVIVVHDYENASREVETQAPHLIIASEQLRQYEAVHDLQGLLFLEKIDKQCPGSLKILILDRQTDNLQEIRNLIDRYLINRIFLRPTLSFDMLGFLDTVTQLLKAIDLFANGYALLVGVGEDLPITTKDAQALYRVLTNPSLAAYPRENIQLLTEQSANRANILNALEQLALQAQNDPEAIIFIYFSGHGGYLQGIEDYLLIPYGCDRNNYATMSISNREFIDKIRAIQAQKLILWLDCCHADDMLERTLGDSFIKSPPTPEIIASLSFENCHLVVASSRGEQFSYADNPYSVFTACLLDALKGRASKDNSDNYVRVFDVLSYLLEEVPKRAYPRLQNPIIPIIEELSEDFPIGCRTQPIVPNDIGKDRFLGSHLFDSEISSAHAEARIALRKPFFEKLSRLPGPQFEKLVFVLIGLGLPRENLGGVSAAQGARVAKLLEWAESPGGCGLERLIQVLKQVMN